MYSSRWAHQDSGVILHGKRAEQVSKSETNSVMQAAQVSRECGHERFVRIFGHYGVNVVLNWGDEVRKALDAAP